MPIYTAQGKIAPVVEKKEKAAPAPSPQAGSGLRRVQGGPGTHGSTYYNRLERCLQLWSNYYNHPAGTVGSSQATDKQALGILAHVYYGHWNAERGARQPGGFLFRGELVEGRGIFLRPADAVRLEAEEQEKIAPTRCGLSWLALVDDAIRIGRGYRQRFEGETGRVIGVEEQRPIAITSPFTGATYDYNPRLDLEWEAPDKGVWLRDLKSTSYRWGDPEEDFSLDIQFLGMGVIGRRIYGARFAGTSVERVRLFPQQVFAERHIPTAAPYALRDWELSRAIKRDQVAQLQKMGLKPDRYPKATSKEACAVWGGCEFRDRCQRGPFRSMPE